MERPAPTGLLTASASLVRGLSLAGALLAAAGCGSDRIVEPAAPPAVQVSAVAANLNNVLSAMVTALVVRADSVAVRYGLAGGELDTITPVVLASGDVALVPLLGLMPETAYDMEFVAYGAGEVASGERLTFVTGSLPEDLPTYTTAGTDPSPGYVAFAAGAYGLVIDNSGRVVWYHRFPEGPGLNFQAQPTGRYVARPPQADPAVPPRWIEIDPLGNETRTFGCARELVPRFHDLLVELDGSYWILCDENRTMDLTELGGLADAHVTSTVVQRIGAAGALLFEWNAFDHFEIDDLEPAERVGPLVNWTHGNALDLDAGGDLLISFRNLSEITKIDTRTGQVVWRMGGLRNEFELQGSAPPAFARQHGVRVTGPGEFLILDNLGDIGGSTAKRILYDEQARTARVDASYASSPPVVAHLGGTTQPLPGGRALVSFGNGGRVEEYDASGGVVWRLEEPGYVFRAQRIRSLYQPGIGYPR